MKSDKKQSLVMIGIVMLIIAGIVLYVTISAPDVYENEEFITSVSTTMKTEKTTVSYPLNLNTASAEELMTIDGISKKTANAIIRYREENGLYSDVSEIMNIKGIGEDIYIKALPFLEV